MNKSDQENINSLIGVDPANIAKLHLFYRSSVIGRRDLGKKLATSIKPIKEFEYDTEFKNRNVEILQAYLKSMGLKIEFLGEEYNIHIRTNTIQSFNTRKGLFIGTEDEYEDIKIREEIQDKYENDVCFVGTNKEYEDLINSNIKDEYYRRTCYNIDID